MGFRMYLGKAAAPITPGSWSAGWNSTGGAAADASLVFGQLSTSETHTNDFAASDGTSGHFIAVRRYVSPAIQFAATVGGNINGQVLCAEAVATDNAFIAIGVKVIKSDGTDRGIMLAVTAPVAAGDEMSTTLTNRSFKDSSGNATIALSSVAVQVGDFIVVEVGYQYNNTTLQSPGHQSGAIFNTTDLPVDQTTTASDNGWVEFSDTSNLSFGLVYIGTTRNPIDNGTNATTPVVISGVGDGVPRNGTLVTGDLLVMIGYQKAASATLAISATGGQTWTSEAAVTSTAGTLRTFWCTYNGAFTGGDPSISYSASVNNTLVAHIYRPPPGTSWAINVAQAGSSAAGTVCTITGQTTTGSDPTITLAMWGSDDDNTWGTLTGTGWVSTGWDQYRNLAGQDASMSAAHKIQTSAGATGNVSKTQLANGPDVTAQSIITWGAAAPAVLHPQICS